MANRLHEQFYELQLAPIKEKGGVIAFRSIRDLASPSPEQAQEKQRLCLTLSYYYTRIFQIYGALALTLMDDIAAMRQMGIMSTAPGRRLVAPGHRPMVYGGSDEERGAVAHGGALTETELGEFAFLSRFLEDTKTEYGYKAKYYSQNGLRGEVFFNPNVDDVKAKSTSSSSAAISYKPSFQRRGVFLLAYDTANKFAKIKLRVERLDASDVFRAIFEEYEYVKSGQNEYSRQNIPSSYLTPSLPLIRRVRSNYGGEYKYTFKDDDRTINEVLQEYMYRLLRFTKALVVDKTILNAPPTGAKTGYESERTGTGTGPSAEILRSLSSGETDTVETLRLGKILRNLQTVKPYGHCIARALQLLDNAPFPNQPAISHICKAKFMEVSVVPTEKGGPTRYSRSGIPEPGKELSTSPGLFALSNLFYDTIAAGTPKLEISQQRGPDGVSTLQQYIEFMRRMAKNFGDNKVEGSNQTRSDESLLRSGLAGIRNLRDKTFCKDHSDGDIPISNEIAEKVYGVVQALFQVQLVHAANCAKIFQMLFDIQQEKSTGRVKVFLHENLLRKGMPEINRINHMARDLLMRYYSTCEEGYMRGVKIVVDHKREEKERSAESQRARAVNQFMKETVKPAPAGGPLVAPGAPPTLPAPGPPPTLPGAPSRPPQVPGIMKRPTVPGQQPRGVTFAQPYQPIRTIPQQPIRK